MKHPQTLKEAAAIRDAAIEQAYAQHRAAVAEIRLRDAPNPFALGVRAKNRIKNLGLSPDDPASVANFGRKRLTERQPWGDNFGKASLAEIEVWLAQKGLKLAP